MSASGAEWPGGGAEQPRRNVHAELRSIARRVGGTRWFRRAADQNLALAQYKLGVAYEQGIGVVETMQERWSGIGLLPTRISRRRSSLAVMYTFGRVVQRNYVRAAEL